LIAMNATLDRTVEAATGALAVHSYSGGAEVVDELADEWRELCTEAAEDQPFYRPEWIRAYLRAFVPRARVLLIAVRLGGRLRLLLPLLEERGTFCKVPVRRLRVPVNFYAGRFDAICIAGPEGEAAILAAWKYLKELRGWNLLHLRDCLEASVVSRLAQLAEANGLRTMKIEDKPSPYVPVPADPKLLQQLPINARLRRQLRQIRRQIAEQGLFLKLDRVETADQNALARFFELEASGWKGQNRSSILASGTKLFFEEIAESAARFGYFALYMLELNGKLIAAHYGFTLRDCYYSAIVAYDESFKQFSPGHLIIEEIVRDCAARGIARYDTTGQDQEWKMRWTTETRPLNHHFVFRGPLGKLAYAVGSRFSSGMGHRLKNNPTPA
jgi:CelD/BcsL family acetyltransferase involved in cellulose biosynthesis